MVMGPWHEGSVGGLPLPFLWAESPSLRSVHKSEANELLEEDPDTVPRRGAGLYFHKRKGQVRSRGSCEAGQSPVSQFEDGGHQTQSGADTPSALNALSCHVCTLQELLRLNTPITHILSKQRGCAVHQRPHSLEQALNPRA